MNKIIFILLGLCVLAGTSKAQQADIAAAKPGVHYGKKIDNKGAITVAQLETSLANSETYSGKLVGEVVQVCKKKGCFITLKREDGKDPVMVRFTDYGYFVPQDIVGKTVVLEGKAKIKETSVAQLQHAAQDMGKTEAEIARIKSPKRDLSFIADGVLVIR